MKKFWDRIQWKGALDRRESGLDHRSKKTLLRGQCGVRSGLGPPGLDDAWGEMRVSGDDVGDGGSFRRLLEVAHLNHDGLLWWLIKHAWFRPPQTKFGPWFYDLSGGGPAGLLFGLPRLPRSRAAGGAMEDSRALACPPAPRAAFTHLTHTDGPTVPGSTPHG